MIPTPKKRGKLKLADNQELVELRKRAVVLNRRARARCELKLRVLPEVFARLLDLSEQESTPYTVIAINALVDGLQRYGEFSTRMDRDALVKVTPMRAYAKDLFAGPVPATDRLKRDSHGPLIREEYAHIADQIAENDPAYIRSQNLQRIVQDISTPLPNSPQLKPVEPQYPRQNAQQNPSNANSENTEDTGDLGLAE